MPNIHIPRQEMPKQAPEDRRDNFNEVALGFTAELAQKEAQRCIQCKKPFCIDGCPVEIDIPAFIKFISEGDFEGALKKVREENLLPGICGRVCPQEQQCEIQCVLGKKQEPVAIGRLERFVADWGKQTGFDDEFHIEEKKKSVAVVGSGPASISCAIDLRRFGYQVTLFEALHKAGGVLQYGIPEFRLPKKIVDFEINNLDELGVDVKINTVIGQHVEFDELRGFFDAVFLGTGAGAPLFLNIEGEKLKGLYSANEFLIRTNLMKAYKFPEYDTPIICGNKVGVIGAGNVAMDAARCAVRLGADEVYILYRRTKKQAPARLEELENALEEGVILKELVNPVRVLGTDDGWVRAIELIMMELGEPDSSGRARPIPIENSEFEMELDTVVVALGTKPNRLFLNKVPELETTPWGTIQVDERLKTNMEGVYAGGDAVRGNATVILALGDGRTAARSIHAYLQNGKH
ncbi:NADPH-dependent glutamate synthase [candidate division WOR-3 bacterium]|nr:NADPH-dependent glutamate synthase [candidate division WOR-3 bacterium]